MIGSSIILVTIGKTKKLWLISTLLEKKLKPGLKPNISSQDISDFTWVTISMPISEIHMSVFLEMMKIVGSNMTTLKS